MNQITHIITGLNVGGAERALHTLLTNGLEGPFRNRVISLMGPGHYGPLIIAAGIPLTCLNMSPGRPTPKALHRLISACKETPADIVQGWMSHGNIASTLAQRVVHPRASLAWNVRLSLEDHRETKVTTRAMIRLGAWLSHRPHAVIYNAERSQQQYTGIGYCDATAHYFPNGFDTAAWRPDADIRHAIRHGLGLTEQSRVIGFVGRGHRQKDINNLFAAFNMIMERHPNAVLVAVGRDLEQYIIPSDRIMLLGQRSDVPDLMRAFDVLCLSSRVEGFPNVIGEAMATGLPCVSTDVGDAREIVGNTGWVAPPRDSIKLAECLDQALTCSPLALEERGQLARKRIINEFSIESVVAKYVKLYNGLLKD